MKGSPRPAASVLLALGILACNVPMPVLADAIPAGPPNFAAQLDITDQNGTVVTSNGVDFTGCPLTIVADVTIAGGQPDSANTTVILYINKVEMDCRELGPLYKDCSPDHLVFRYPWMPAGYGMYDITACVYNNMTYDTLTACSIYHFIVRDSDLRLFQVFADRSEAVIGVSEVSITADVGNLGNDAGFASVDFLLDGQTPIGTLQGPVPKEGGRFTLRRVLSADDITEGAHTVTASLTDLVQTQKTTMYIDFWYPFISFHVTALDVSLGTVTVAKGATVTADLTATVTNAGNVPQSGFTVVFFDGPDPLASVGVDGPVEAGRSLGVRFAWNVSDAVAFGLHTLSAGLGGQDPLHDILPKANLTVLGVEGVAAAGLSVSPKVQYEGREVLLSIRLVNGGNADSNGRTVMFRMQDPAGGPPVAIGSLSGIDIPAGGSAQMGLSWTLPSVSSEKATRTAEAVMDGMVLAAVNVTVLRCHAGLDVRQLRIPEGLRVGDRADLWAEVQNNGTEPVKGVRVDFCDGNISLASSEPFDIPGGGSEQLEVTVTIPGPGDAVHLFSARAGEAVRSMPRMVGHRLAPAKMRVASFSVDPDFEEARSGSFRQELILVLVINNTGELPGTATVSIIGGDRDPIVTDISIIVQPANNTTRMFLWIVSGGGYRRAIATVDLDGHSEKAVAEADIPYAASEPDRTTVAAAITLVVPVLVLLLAVAGRKWGAWRARARQARKGADRVVAVLSDRRVVLEPRLKRLSKAPPRRGK